MIPTDKSIAQFNYAELLHPVKDDRSRGFVDGTNVITRVALRSAGFIWAFETTGPAGTMQKPILDNPLISMNMSVWESLPKLEYFVYNTLHKSFLDRRANWFAPTHGPTMVLWWVDADHRPTLDEALDRLAMLRTEGPSARAFDWTYANREYPQ